MKSIAHRSNIPTNSVAAMLPCGFLYANITDLAAAALARELKPVKLVYISDVPGLMNDPQDPSTIIQSINRKEAFELIEQGVISGGMIPKVKSAVDALNAGVRKVHFIDGRLRHTLLLEIFTPEGIGTEIVREQR